MKDDTGFLLGYKPAIFVGADEKAAYLCQEYPHITEKDFPALQETSVIFFQNDQLKRECLEKYLLQQIRAGSPEYHRCLGETLGLPPPRLIIFCALIQYKRES